MLVLIKKKFFKKFLFLPKFFTFLPSSLQKKQKHIRPYFGINTFSTGGPYIRTKRLIEYFGNHLFAPNIIYAQSYWSVEEILDCIEYSKKTKIPIIFNQNGWFYRAWYDGNSKYRNKLLCKIQNKSQLTIYQSKFCKIFSKILNKSYEKNSIVLHNDVPNYKIKKLSKKNFFLVSGIFDKNSAHVLLPAVKAFYYLSQKKNLKIKKIKLIVTGVFKSSAKTSGWYKEYLHYSSKLEKINYFEYRGIYNSKNKNFILKDIAFSLHLKYNDPCPNAVVENIKKGIIHIYSNSGSLKELLGHAGVPINLEKNNTNKLLSVNYRVLAKKILISIKHKNLLYNKTRLQRNKFNYKNYLQIHKNIFEKFILTTKN